MIQVQGAKVKISGYGINIHTEFTVLCNELLQQGIMDQDDILHSVALASIPEEVLLSEGVDMSKIQETMGQEAFNTIWKDLVGGEENE